MDVRWQWHAAELDQQFLQRLDGLEAQQKEFAIAPNHGYRTAIVKDDTPASLGFLADAELRTRFVRSDDALDQNLDRAATLLAAIKPRRQHARVVENQKIARCKKLDEIGEMTILEPTVRSIHDEKAARRALSERRLRDQFGRQLEMEIGFLQERGFEIQNPRW